MLFLVLGLAAASWVGYKPVVRWWKTRRAVSIPQEALQAARSIEYTGARAAALHDVAEAMARAGRFEEALQTARSIEDVPTRVGALVELAKAVLGVREEPKNP